MTVNSSLSSPRVCNVLIAEELELLGPPSVFELPSGVTGKGASPSPALVLFLPHDAPIRESVCTGCNYWDSALGDYFSALYSPIRSRILINAEASRTVSRDDLYGMTRY